MKTRVSLKYYVTYCRLSKIVYNAKDFLFKI